MTEFIQKTSFPGSARIAPALAKLGNKLYLACGYDGSPKQDFWEYDIAGDTWTQKTNYPETCYALKGWSDGGHIYFGTGIATPSGPVKDTIYVYYTDSNVWALHSPSFPTARYAATVQYVEGFGFYGGLGYNLSSVYQDWWLDAGLGSWTQKANPPGTNCFAASALYEDFVYIIGGRPAVPGGATNSVWKYNPQNNQWTTLNNFPASFMGGVAFVHEGNLYAGLSGAGAELYIYDKDLDSWSLSGIAHPLGALSDSAYCQSSSGYVVCGSNGTMQNALYYFGSTVSPPEANGNLTQSHHTVEIEDTSTDPNDDLDHIDINWDDGSDVETIEPGGTAIHVYENETGSYTPTLTAYDSGDLSDTKTFDEIDIVIYEPDYSYESHGLELSVNSSDIVPPTDLTITEYRWNWGDGSGYSYGAETSHTYLTQDTYTVTLRLTLSNDEIYSIIKEISMSTPTITALSSFMLAVGDELTVTGTNFKAVQGDGFIKIGVDIDTAVALTGLTWGDTSIVGTIPSIAFTGTAYIFVQNSDDELVQANAYVIGADDYDTAELKLGLMSKVYLDGRHVGFLEGSVELSPTAETLPYRPNDRQTTVKTFVIRSEMGVRMTLSQINPTNLAVALGAQLVGTKIVKIKGTLVSTTGVAEVPEHDIAFTDAAGVTYFIPKAQILEPTNITLDSQNVMQLPLNLRAMADDNGDVAIITFP